jgi:dTMP kinase
MAGQGRLIAVCGIDGSGKTTQTALLAERAEAEGLRVRTVSFPRYGQGFFADLIERYLRGEFAGRAADVNPYLAALPYALDRWQAGAELRGWLAEGALVICNRYTPANVAHQGSKLGSAEERRGFGEWIRRLEYDVLEVARPDLCVLLDMPPAVASRLAARRAAAVSSRAPDIHEGDMEHLEATAAAYREAAAGAPERWAVVPCAEADEPLPADEVARRVWEQVREAL